MRGGHFAHAVAHHCVRLDAPTAEQFRQRHLEGEQQRLHHVDLFHARTAFIRVDLLQQ